MMKIKIFTLMLVFLSFASCSKDKFPIKNDLIGTWIEQTDRTFKYKLIFEEEKLYFFGLTFVDTLSYRLDKNQKQIIFISTNAIETRNDILFNENKKLLTIWDFLGGTDERIRTNVFKKE